MKIVFPTNQSRYYFSHLSYIREIFRYCGATINCQPGLTLEPCVFKCKIDGKDFIFDLSDYEDISYEIKNEIVLKRTIRTIKDNIYPMGTLMGYYRRGNHSQVFNHLINARNEIYEKPNDYLYSQRIWGNAFERRGNLKKQIGHVKLQTSPQTYWDYARKFKYNIFLPGANLYVLDRAPSELMFLGNTIMQPKIDILFPNFKKLEAGTHYIEIADDGSDCLEKMAGDTGEAAKEFMSCMLPNNLIKWWTSL